MRPFAPLLVIALSGCASDTCDQPCPEGSACVAGRCRTACATLSDCGAGEVCFRGYCEVGDLRPDLVDGAAAGDAPSGDPPTSGDPPASGDPLPGDITPECNNNVVDGSERCDGTDLNGRIDCTDFNWGSGPITCMVTCAEFDLSACLNAPGQCGTGSIMAQQQCDNEDFNGETCVTLGFSSGTLACNSNCSFDITPCIP